ncbi:MAG TPA: hypothetical protein P5551_06280 [Syntrophales bacterium]|jgi:hypothetical protein|nr:hypothetical protein [Syntrophales bacterium]HRT61950.1 hypothetical protein [Syntrophales bacterium]
MKRTVVLGMMFLLSLAIASVSAAENFSADVIHRGKGYTGQSKVYVQGNKIRLEPKGQSQYSIVRSDLNKTWVVMPDQKMYMESKYDPSQVPVQKRVRGEMSRKLVGSETIDGHPAQKYEVTYRDGGKVMKSYQWVATDINFPVKTAATDGSWSMEYRNIRMGTQPESLFEIPKGYTTMTVPAYPGGMMPGKGKKPYQP